jgi:hypothetical protein
MSTVLRDNLLDKGIMPHERMTHCISLLLPQGGAALGSAEEEGDGASWQLGQACTTTPTRQHAAVGASRRSPWVEPDQVAQLELERKEALRILRDGQPRGHGIVTSPELRKLGSDRRYALVEHREFVLEVLHFRVDRRQARLNAVTVPLHIASERPRRPAACREQIGGLVRSREVCASGRAFPL